MNNQPNIRAFQPIPNATVAITILRDDGQVKFSIILFLITVLVP